MLGSLDSYKDHVFVSPSSKMQRKESIHCPAPSFPKFTFLIVYSYSTKW